MPLLKDCQEHWAYQGVWRKSLKQHSQSVMCQCVLAQRTGTVCQRTRAGNVSSLGMQIGLQLPCRTAAK